MENTTAPNMATASESSNETIESAQQDNQIVSGAYIAEHKQMEKIIKEELPKLLNKLEKETNNLLEARKKLEEDIRTQEEKKEARIKEHIRHHGDMMQTLGAIEKRMKDLLEKLSPTKS